MRPQCSKLKWKVEAVWHFTLGSLQPSPEQVRGGKAILKLQCYRWGQLSMPCSAAAGGCPFGKETPASEARVVSGSCCGCCAESSRPLLRWSCCRHDSDLASLRNSCPLLGCSSLQPSARDNHVYVSWVGSPATTPLSTQFAIKTPAYAADRLAARQIELTWWP